MADSLFRGGAAALALLTLTPAQAQEIAPPPTPNADALAAQMRILGSNPRDVTALLTAADLSTRLGDAPAALAFLARAQAVDPSNPRINAGRASAMVLLERPGEALRLFDQATRAGVAMEPYLLQRGLAYDLTGQPGHAQRDYRQLLSRRSDDEATRRLALSLGISGQRDEAMALLDPLLRRSDRAAWRARACIMAMTGDVAGAQKIAGSMIPGGAGLAPFFARLQALSPADRAFAVHFGEVTPTLARANDARLAPQVAALPTRAPQPVAVAPVAVARAPVATPPERLSRRERQRLEREERRAARSGVQVARREPGSMLPSAAARPSTASPASGTVSRGAPIAGSPVTVASTPQPVASVVSAPTQQVATSRPSATTPPQQAVPTPTAPAQVASASPTPATPTPVTGTALPPQAPASALPTQVAAVSPAPALAAPVAGSTPSAVYPVRTPVASSTAPVVGSSAVATVASAPLTPHFQPAPTPVQVAAAPTPVTPATSALSGVSLPRAAAPWAVTPDTSASASPVPIATTPRPDAPAVAAIAPAPTPTAPSPAAAATAPVVRTAAVARRNTDLLASIVAGISVPASELNVAPPETARPAPARATPVRTAAVEKPVRTAEPKKPEPKKVESAKSEPKKPDPAKAEPARWFVQVAGGARAADLDKDWKRLAAKSPAAFKGKAAWTTPLRATNRLLAGPFASQGAAMAFVNQLAKDGSSAFAWRSEAGQKIEKLAP